MVKRMLDTNPNNRPKISEINQFFKNNSIYLDSSNIRVEYSKKRIVLIGEVGSGKTTLFNRLTGANENSLSGGQIKTRQLVQGYSLCDTNFEVIDIPDCECIEEGILQAAGLIAGFNVGDINQIILVIRHDRYDQMKDQITKYLRILERYKENITIYISTFDQVGEKDQQSQEQTIRDQIFQTYKIKSIIFNKKNTNQTIVIQIANIIQSIDSFKVSLIVNQIMNDFEYKINNDELMIIVAQIQYEIESKLQKIFRSLSIQLNNINYQYDGNYFDILQNLKHMCIKQVKEFFQKYQSELSMTIENEFDNEEQNYTPYILLLKSQNKELKNFFQKIKQRKRDHPKFSNKEDDDLINNDLLNLENTGLTHYLAADQKKLEVIVQQLIANRKIIPKIIKK